MARGNRAQAAASWPDCAICKAMAGRPPLARSKPPVWFAATPWADNQVADSSGVGQLRVWTMQRLRTVGNKRCAAWVANTKRVSPGGSSRVLSKALAVTRFMSSAGKTITTLPRLRALVRWQNSTVSRTASTRISRLGLRAFSSTSCWAFSPKGQPRSSKWVSGISTRKSAWVRTAMLWQLGQVPQAPSGVACSHNQALARDSARG